VNTYFTSTREKNTSLHLQIFAVAFHIIINKSSNHPKVQLSVKQTRRLGAHVIVMVPASESVLMRISKLGFTSIKLGSVTLKNRSLSRASLALLQDPTTTHS
jgi:D-arabinose 1-dehydrogenase-like Zn-dependent alcohol dehydrogenase